MFGCVHYVVVVGCVGNRDGCDGGDVDSVVANAVDGVGVCVVVVICGVVVVAGGVVVVLLLVVVLVVVWMVCCGCW